MQFPCNSEYKLRYSANVCIDHLCLLLQIFEHLNTFCSLIAKGRNKKLAMLAAKQAYKTGILSRKKRVLTRQKLL